MRRKSAYRLCLALVFLLSGLQPAWGGAPPPQPREPGRSSSPVTGCPLEIRSQEKDGVLTADVSTTVDDSFTRLSQTLTRPEAWCEFLPLVFNVKSCISREVNGQTELTLYVGRKFFEVPDESIRIGYHFQILEREKGHLRVLLSAPEGAFGTRDYRIELEARPARDGRTLVRMHSSFRPSLRSKLATQAYLATSGREKVGFSAAAQQGGDPVYVGGLKGIIERNAMRYYLALQAFLETQHLPEKERFETRLNTWFRLTEKYPQQLYEMDRQTYIDAKRRERQYQLQLQKNLG